MKYKKIREEELKNKIGVDWFMQFDTTGILGNIDFAVYPKQGNLFGRTPLLWAEAKTGTFDTTAMFVQLILTIGKARTFDKTLPPAFLGTFDFKKIAFIPYLDIQNIFYLNDFNWNVTPSNHTTKEFKLVKERIEATLKLNSYVYEYEKDEEKLRAFIKNNLAKGTTSNKIKISKNNFIPIYIRWLEFVKPIIDVNWDSLKKANISDSDFYLADLFVDDKDTQNIADDTTTRDSLFVVFQNQGYKIAKEDIRQMFDATIDIKNKKTYQLFWKSYKRPPITEFQDYIIKRRDLLVPQDIRERKGAFFTPRQWVELSQKYLTDYLGENWQDEYFIWDCASGTGNLLAGLSNKYNIYASTLDQADVNVMYERIEHGANLLKAHVFQFDFLNGDFSQLPKSLREILDSENKRRKLVIYINPPYAEVSSVGTRGKSGVNQSKMHDKYKDILGTAGREIYAQFIIRIYSEIEGATIAEFSKLKILQGPAFINLRNYLKAKIEKMFIAPAYTFDNVKGRFPIGFKIWNTENKVVFKSVTSDIYNEVAEFIGTKEICAVDKSENINKWISPLKAKDNFIGFLAGTNGNDFQQNGIVYIINKKEQMRNPRGIWINPDNLVPVSVYYSVRHCIDQTWINDRDQFLVPDSCWANDFEFQNDCLAYTIFCTHIESKNGTNHWIPFTEAEVKAKEKFSSNFMSDFIEDKIELGDSAGTSLFMKETDNCTHPRSFSKESKTVFNLGLKLWKYYHSKSNINVNASLYEIREHFQGRNTKGKMNNSSNDEIYTELFSALRDSLNALRKKIEPKVYEYRFLRE